MNPPRPPESISGGKCTLTQRVWLYRHLHKDFQRSKRAVAAHREVAGQPGQPRRARGGGGRALWERYGRTGDGSGLLLGWVRAVFLGYRAKREQGAAAQNVIPMQDSLPSITVPRQETQAEPPAAQYEHGPLAPMMPLGLLPRPPRHTRREHFRARALGQRPVPATSRLPASKCNQALDTPAQRRFHTERATRRVFGRVPTYLPRVDRNVLPRPVQVAKSHVQHQQVEVETGTVATEPATQQERDAAAQPKPPSSTKKRASKAEEHMKEMQLLRDKIAIREAFGVIDDDGGGSVEAPEVLKALKALGKKLDDKKFWSKFQKLCDEGKMVISAAQFEKLMLKLLESSRRKAARKLGGQSVATPSASAYQARKEVQSLDSRVRYNVKNRLYNVREREDFGKVVRRTRSETMQFAKGGNEATAVHQGPTAKKKSKKKERNRTRKRQSTIGSPGVSSLESQRTRTPVPVKDGSEWMVEALQQHRGIADIYSALTSLRSSTLQARIVDPPEDLR